MPINLALILVLGVVIVTRRFSPLWGGILGVAAAVGVGIWGWMALDDGMGIAFIGFELTRPMFVAFVAAWFAFECYGLYLVRRHRA